LAGVIKDITGAQARPMSQEGDHSCIYPMIKRGVPKSSRKSKAQSARLTSCVWLHGYGCHADKGGPNVLWRHGSAAQAVLRRDGKAARAANDAEFRAIASSRLRDWPQMRSSLKIDTRLKV